VRRLPRRSLTRCARAQRGEKAKAGRPFRLCCTAIAFTKWAPASRPVFAIFHCTNNGSRRFCDPLICASTHRPRESEASCSPWLFKIFAAPREHSLPKSPETRTLSRYGLSTYGVARGRIQARPSSRADDFLFKSATNVSALDHLDAPVLGAAAFVLVGFGG
jgi:hypothetical protein